MLSLSKYSIKMATQYIVNDRGEKTAVIVPINEYENLLHQHQFGLELSDEYKAMIDQMVEKENNGQASYVSFKKIKDQFLGK